MLMVEGSWKKVNIVCTSVALLSFQNSTLALFLTSIAEGSHDPFRPMDIQQTYAFGQHHIIHPIS
jgi:hypothetical protein